VSYRGCQWENGVLGQMGAAARSALPALRKALADPNPDVSQAAAAAVKAISEAVSRPAS
jgi:20S proteasome alpha/beta subunit